VLPVVQKWCLYYIFVNDIIHWCRHEIAGVVIQVGADVKGFKVGDHVGVGTYVNSCRDCEHCNSSLENHCPKGVYTFNGIDTDGTVTKGGYSTHIVVHERYGSTVLLGCSNKKCFYIDKS
jgi:D-arabinose 1-dehydrogenase-like Zn-dependent alcohol dehydrogenase